MIASRTASLVALATSLALAPSQAFASPAQAAAASGAQSLAQSLFDEAVTLMEKGDYAAACPKLAESQRLDPGGGTLLNLGLCREQEGKLASAWIAYNEALSQAIKDGRKDREATARQRLAAIGSRLSTLVIDVPAEVALIEGVEVRLDGALVRQPAWGVAAPVDTGTHEILVTAPGRLARSRRLTVDAEGANARVALEPPARDPRSLPTLEQPARDSSAVRRAAAFATAGVGGALLVSGGIAGALALDARSRSDDECPAGRCTQRGVALNEQAQAWAWASNVGLGLGGVAAVVSAALFVTSRSHVPASAWVSPLLAPGQGGVALKASF